MTIEEKLRFLVDRTEDEQEFYIGDGYDTYRFIDFRLRYIEKDGNDYDSSMSLNRFLSSSLKTQPAWEFTEDEKLILRNIEDRWRWIARDESGILWLYRREPHKQDNLWLLPTHDLTSFSFFDHLFKSVQWEDDEPCEFRKFI